MQRRLDTDVRPVPSADPGAVPHRYLVHRVPHRSRFVCPCGAYPGCDVISDACFDDDCAECEFADCSDACHRDQEFSLYWGWENCDYDDGSDEMGAS